jgi:hypothetical protein
VDELASRVCRLPGGDKSMKHLRGVFAVPCLCAALAVGCGGGGHSPTEAPKIASVAGNWAGSWSVAGIPFPLVPVLSLNQSGTTVTGTISLLGNTAQLSGAVSGLTFNWQIVDGGCGTFNGTSNLPSFEPSTMSGIIVLSTLGCVNPDFETGPVTWSRGSSALRSADSLPGRRGNVGDIAHSVRTKKLAAAEVKP